MRHSPHTVDETARIIQDILKLRRIPLFALIDHSGEAEKAGLHMPNTKLLIFGNPRAGTPIMLAARAPLSIFPSRYWFRKMPRGDVWLSYNAPAYVQARHGFPIEQTGLIAAVDDIAKSAAEKIEA